MPTTVGRIVLCERWEEVNLELRSICNEVFSLCRPHNCRSHQKGCSFIIKIRKMLIVAKWAVVNVQKVNRNLYKVYIYL